MNRGIQGVLHKVTIGGEAYSTFEPADLPPNPPLEFSSEIRRVLSKADQMVGRLDGLSTLIPHPDLLISFYIRKEAVLSSQIEGTQSTLAELLLFEIEPETGNEDTGEVLNYVQAMRHGLKRLREGFPLSLRLIREMHEILLRTGRGSRSTPGAFRTSQNWIGGTRPGNALYNPPAVHHMISALDSFEKFMHSGSSEFEVLVQCALMHVQFESIHPFVDGNGRLGRLLITLLMVERGLLTQPLLYLSLYLKQHRSEYYRLLQEVRFTGDWESWTLFFLNGVASTAERANTLARQILSHFRADEDRVRALLTRRRHSALQVLGALQMAPVATVAHISASAGMSYNAAATGLETLKSAGIVHEFQGSRGRLYSYRSYLALLDEGTEPVTTSAKDEA